MKGNNFLMTPAQFSKLHKINKRTLHYYDEIGLFSPILKKENGYRYYDLSQSIMFEYIKMLKDIKMPLDEIKLYINQPEPKKFVEFANQKEKEIENTIQNLIDAKNLLRIIKEKQVEALNKSNDFNIEIIYEKEEELDFVSYNPDESNIYNMFCYIKNFWDINRIRTGVGSFISVENILKNNFDLYEGIYTKINDENTKRKTFCKPEGKYICAYHNGDWDKIEKTYKKIINFVNEHNIELTGYSYEMCLNEYFIKNKKEDCVVKILIKIK